MAKTHSSKLLYFIGTLSGQDRRKFRQYLISPYFNTQAQLPELFDLICEEVSRKSRRSEAALYSAMQSVPQPAFDQNWFRKSKTALLHHLLDFMRLEEYDRETPRRQYYLLKAFNRRNLPKYFPAYYEEAIRVLEAEENPDFNYSFSYFEVEHEQIVYTNTHHVEEKHLHINTALEKLEYGYLLHKLRFAQEGMILKDYYNKEVSISGLKATLEYVRGSLGGMPPLIQLYYRLYCTFADEEDRQIHYGVLKKMLPECLPILEYQEGYALLRYMITFASDRLNKKEDYIEELFYWNKLFIKKGYLLEDMEVFPTLFQNILIVACQLGRFVWANSFFKAYGGHLIVNGNIAGYNFLKGILLFFEGDYKTSREAFGVIASYQNEKSYQNEARLFLILIDYELRQYDEAFKVGQTFWEELTRDSQLLPRQKTPIVRMLTFILELISVRNAGSIQLETLYHKIQQSPIRTFAKNWLISKIQKIQSESS